MSNDAILCAINGCAHQANLVDTVSGLPVCYDCEAEMDAVRSGNTYTVWDALSEGWKLGVFGAAFGRAFGRK